MKILLAIDGSPCSEAAVKEVATTPWPASSQVKVLSAATVLQPNAPDPLHVVTAMRLELLERARAQLRDLVERTAAWLRENAVEKSLQLETAVIDVTPQVVIIEEAERWGADLIMVGCHGYRPVKRFLLGSVFSSPKEVFAHEALTYEQKVEVLRRWEYDASEAAVAEEEGMPGAENDTLHQILSALHRLTGGVDVEHAGPTKHRSLPRVPQKRG